MCEPKWENQSVLLKKARLKGPWSQERLAHALGFKNGQFPSNWERNLCGVPLRVAKKTCLLLGIEPSQLHRKILLDWDAKISSALGTPKIFAEMIEGCQTVAE